MLKKVNNYSWWRKPSLYRIPANICGRNHSIGKALFVQLINWSSEDQWRMKWLDKGLMGDFTVELSGCDASHPSQHRTEKGTLRAALVCQPEPTQAFLNTSSFQENPDHGIFRGQLTWDLAQFMTLGRGQKEKADGERHNNQVQCVDIHMELDWKKPAIKRHFWESWEILIWTGYRWHQGITVNFVRCDDGTVVNIR